MNNYFKGLFGAVAGVLLFVAGGITDSSNKASAGAIPGSYTIMESAEVGGAAWVLRNNTLHYCNVTGCRVAHKF